ncbi:MAG: YkgJ family cysteine cluster protein [Candidatus Kariarchaeaceae archaeon]|jgi:Fe-S-cluster containining protein
MQIKLPILEAGMLVGQLNILDQSISLEHATPIAFSCQMSTSCCTTVKIPVTDFDIQRIEAHGYALDQIIELSSPMLRLPKTKFGSIEKNYWMKRKPYDNSCTFLQDIQCSIHAFKPYGCRIFPFSIEMLDEERINVRIHPSNLCNSVRVVDLAKSENTSLLKGLMETILHELKRRERYFDEFSDQI